MKKHWRHFLSMVLAASFALTLMATGAMAEDKLTLSWLGTNPPLEDGTWGELRFEEIFGVDVQIIRATDDSQKNTLYASGNVPDYIDLGSASMSAVASLNDQGIIAPIPMELIREHMPRYYAMCTADDPMFFDYAKIDGEVMAIPRYSATDPVPLGAAIRADWLKAVGIDKVPETLEELEAAFVAFRENDPDGNGQKDTYALTAAGGENGTAVTRYLFPSIFAAYNVNPYIWQVNGAGELQFGFTTEAFKEALKTLRRWYEMELIDPEFVTDLHRNSGADVTLKFATGRTGYMDNVSFDDYEYDNDGHVSAKWCANNAAWQKYFEDNKDAVDLYKYNCTADFDDSYIEPYYINLNPVSVDGVGGSYIAGTNVNDYLCFGANVTEEKMIKLLQIIESLAMDEDVYVNHFGPEGEEWLWNADKTQRIYNVDWVNHPNYHPQGQKSGKGWCLWPMYFCNPEFLTTVYGERQAQRYEHVMPLFNSFKSIHDELRVALSAQTENPELATTFVNSYIVKAIRGDVHIDATFEETVASWMQQGGEEMTRQANEWYASLK